AKPKTADDRLHAPIDPTADDLLPPPDGGYGWAIVAASFCCNVVVDGIGYCFGVFLTAIAAHYGASKGETAWVGSILAGSTMCAGPVAGALANRFGCRAVCIAGGIVGAAAFALSMYCPTLTSLMFVYGFIGGTGFGLIYLPAVVCVGYYFESKRSLATGISVCGSGFGAFAFAPLGTYLLDRYGWQGANLCLAGLILCCVVFGAVMKPLEVAQKVSTVPLERIPSKQLLPRNNTFSGWQNNGPNAPYISNLSLNRRKGSVVPPMTRKDVFYSGSILNLKEFQSQKSLHDYRQSIRTKKKTRSESSCLSQLLDLSLLKDPVFLTLGISNIFAMAAVYIPFVYLVDCAKADGIEAGKASFLISIIGIVNTVSRIGFGYIADFPSVSSFQVNNVCLCVAAASLGLAPFCHTYLTYTVMAVFFAAAMAGYISLTSIILVDLLGLDKLTDAFGLIILFRGFAAFVGSPAAGMIYDATASYDVPFYVAGGLFAVAAIVSFSVPCFVKKSAEGDRDESLVPMNERV
ncbi:unnamed protein product, partial [Phaedon cochleariae]